MSTNPNFNYVYQNQNKNVTTTTTEGVYDAIIDYSPTVTDQLLAQNPDIKAKEQQGLVRISVEANVAPLIKKATDLQFDGHSYEVKTGDVPRGMFDEFNYFDFWLIRKN